MAVRLQRCQSFWGDLTRAVIPRIGEKRAAYLGVAAAAIAYLFYGLVKEGWMVYCIIAFQARLAASRQPALRDHVAQHLRLIHKAIAGPSAPSMDWR
ncbi:MAG: hypothetical protein R3C60_12560 [Parvularculaceae bacterium]